MLKIKLFENQEVRVVWDKNKEEWYFSIVDVIRVLTGSTIPKRYWADLKIKLKSEGSEVYENIVRLKMRASDGKMRLTDVATTEEILRLIQSIPSKKAEPFKLWLAKVGNERINEIQDPELAINRAMQTYLNKGYSETWINQRLKSIDIRNELTSEWQRVGINNPSEFAILTNEIIKAWSGKTVKEYKQFKNLKKESLRDNMTNMELVLNMLGEAATKEISESENPLNFKASKNIAKEGGSVANAAKSKLEKRLNKSIITSKNYRKLLK